MYLNRKWRLDEGLRKLFTAAGITMNFLLGGRCRRSVVASFHSLRHTFVSLSANAGVPLPVVQSIVGHCSTAMTRHYYHENLDALRSAVESIPAMDERLTGNGKRQIGFSGRADKIDSFPKNHVGHVNPVQNTRREGVPARLKRLERCRAQGLVTEEEYAAQRERILGEL